MASLRDIGQLASQLQLDTYSQGLRTIGRSVAAASETDSSEMVSARYATPQAFEALQRKIERLERKIKKLREAESEAELEREALEQENIQLKMRQPIEDTSYTAQLVEENTALRRSTRELMEKLDKYEHARQIRRGRDAADDIYTAGFCKTLRQHNDAIDTLSEAHNQLVHSFQRSRQEKRDEDKSVDECLLEEAGVASDKHAHEGQFHEDISTQLDVEPESAPLAGTPYQSRWDPDIPDFQGRPGESKEPPLESRGFSGGSSLIPEMGTLNIGLSAKEKTGIISDKPLQKATETEVSQHKPVDPWVAWVAEQRAKRRKQESRSLSSTEKPRAAYSEVAMIQTPPVKPITGVASSSKKVSGSGTNSEPELSPRTLLSQTLSEFRRYVPLPKQVTGFSI